VSSAVEDYVKQRQERALQSDPHLGSGLRKHVLGDAEFASIPLAKLRQHHFDAWRARLPLRGSVSEYDDRRTIGRSTYNRLLNDLRAALNEAFERGRRELPPQLKQEITAGTRALPIEETARKQILTDAQVTAIVRAACSTSADADGDFGRLVALLAATGARFGQLAGLDVADVQLERRRVLVKPSHKGRTRKPKPAASVPLSDGVLELLRPAVEGRAPEEPLLQRWAYRRGKRLEWVKDRRERWTGAHQMDALWTRAVDLAGVPAGTVPYALRHSSIVRALKAGVPLRIVAANHDTSTAMLERHYSRFISEASDEIARLGSLVL
jgi:integrase